MSGRLGAALRRLARQFAVLLAVLLVLGACVPERGSASPPAASRRSAVPAILSHYRPEPAGHEGGTVSVGHWESPSNLSPLHNSEATAAVVERALFAGLVVLDNQLGALPDLAAAVPTLDNGGVRLDGEGMQVTYRLRPGLQWSDGRALTAADVEFTWHLIADPQSPKVRVSRDGYQRIARIETPDEATVRLVFSSLYPPFLTLFPFVLPRHRLEGIPLAALPDDRFWNQPDVVSGPYKIEHLRPDAITLVRNEAWSAGRAGQRPHLDRVQYRLFPDKGALLRAMTSGQLDAGLGLSEGDVGNTGGKFDVQAQPALEYEQVTFNQEDPNPTSNRPPLWKGDPDLLRALDLAINRPELERRVLQGRGRLAVSPLVSALPYAQTRQVPPRVYDLDQANRLLDQDGWIRGSDGVRVKNGRRLAFTLTTTRGSPVRKMVEDILVEGWSAVGAQVPPTELPADVLFRPWPRSGLLSLARGNYEAALWTWVTGADPDAIFQMEHSSQIPSAANPGGANFGRFADPEIDRWLLAGRSRLDPAARSQAYQAFEAAYSNYRGELPLFERMSVSLQGHRLHNFLPNPSSGTAFWNIQDWWIPK